MFSNQTPNYGLPQWGNDDTPTWLGDMNGAFADIDANLKRVEEKANQGGELGERVDEVETNVANIITKIGTDVIDTIGTSITNAIVNLKSAIDTATTNITNLTTKIGNVNISDVGDSITQAIRNLADRGIPQPIIDRITALETSVAGLINQVENILTKIGNDVISSVGTSITNAIVNLKSAIDTATTNITNLTNKIGNTDIGQSITEAIYELRGYIDRFANEISGIKRIVGSLESFVYNDITILIGNTDISDVGDSITQAIRNLADTGVPQTIMDRIVALETSVTNIVAKIGTDVIDTIGTSITNAIVNLNTAITNIATKIGNKSIYWDSITDAIGDTDITEFATSITSGFMNLKNAIDTATTNITNLTNKIGTDVIDTIGTSITNAIVNLKNLIDAKLNKNWTYVGILSASTGSTITVGDDWSELLIAIRISEGSSYYNLTNVLPKEGFTRGNPTGNQTFAGFFWTDTYNAKVRLGLEGTGDNRNLKLNFSNAAGWSINGIYVLKR